MESYESHSIKIMMASLQRQRNTALDRVVDLETSVAIKDLQIKELEERFSNELSAASATIDSLRNNVSEKSLLILQLQEKLDSYGLSIVPDETSVSEIHGEQKVIDYDDSVSPVETTEHSSFEDSVVHDDSKKETKKGIFGKSARK